jgi:hypothetical protein
MQAEVPGVLNLEKETAATKAMYGLDQETTESFGTRCLMARQLVEKGVRFVQLYTPSQSWDSHTNLLTGHAKNAKEVDQPIAALIKDLNSEGCSNRRSLSGWASLAVLLTILLTNGRTRDATTTREP